MEKQNETEINELNYLEEMGEKAVEVLKGIFLDKQYPLTKEYPFPMEMMDVGANILVKIAVANTPILGYHVVPMVEGHLYMLNVQDKNRNTVADVIFFGNKENDQLTIEDIIVTYKPGAILYRYEELAKEEEEEVYM